MKPENKGFYILSMTFFVVCCLQSPHFLKKNFDPLFVAVIFTDPVSTCSVFLAGAGESFMNMQRICGLSEPNLCVLLL